MNFLYYKLGYINLNAIQHLVSNTEGAKIDSKDTKTSKIPLIIISLICKLDETKIVHKNLLIRYLIT